MKYETPEMTTLTPAIKAIQGPGTSGMKDETHQLLDSSRRSLFELILPDDPITARIAPSTISLRVVIGSKRFEVKKDDAPLAHFGSFALSPDGQSLVTTLSVLDVPSVWETLYPPPPSTVSTNRIHAGHYDAKRRGLLLGL